MKSVDGLSDIQNYIVLLAQVEIGRQINFALTAFENITKKGEGNILLTFSSIHSFLTHCANISKILWSSRDRNGEYLADTVGAEVGNDLAQIISADDFVLLKDRSFRNDLDHYDQRMVKWIKDEYPKHKNGDPNRRPISDLTIGDKNQKAGPNALHLRNYNPDSKTYTYGNRDLNLDEMKNELLRLQTFIDAPTFEVIS